MVQYSPTERPLDRMIADVNAKQEESKNMRSSIVSRDRRRLGLVAAAAAASLALGACGSSSDDSKSTSNSSAAKAAPTASAVTDAKKVVAMSDGKLVYSSQVEPSSTSDIEA